VNEALIVRAPASPAAAHRDGTEDEQYTTTIPVRVIHRLTPARDHNEVSIGAPSARAVPPE
jgi:hypothetical protein